MQRRAKRRRIVRRSCLIFMAVVCAIGESAFGVSIATVLIGDAGNLNDPATGNLYGGVPYTYRMGTTEVTAAQYVEFLNAVAATDLYGLYSTRMGNDPQIAGISRSGTPGSYSYAEIGASGNFPVSEVDWGDAARFANWLHNGQPTGAQDESSTEDGAYPLHGAVTDAELLVVKRNKNATWAIPTENEWYKSAYYQPAVSGGDSDGYWLYPTATNVEPNSDQPPGASPVATNVANFIRDDHLPNGYNDGHAITGSFGFNFSQNYLSHVAAYPQSSSYYGTFDQAGNVAEWNESLRFDGAVRGIRGGSWFDSSILLRSSTPFNGGPSVESKLTGFRLSRVPEPSSFALGLVLATLAIRLRTR